MLRCGFEDRCKGTENQATLSPQWRTEVLRRLLTLLVCAVLITAGFTLSRFIRSSKAQIISATDINPDPNIFEAYLTAQELDVTIAGQTVHAMVYKDDPPLPFTSSGAGIPAPEIKVKVGETVIIHFKNNLPTASASIHWHGIELDNDSDGTAVTQDAVLAGQSYTYKFKNFPARPVLVSPTYVAQQRDLRGNVWPNRHREQY